MRLITAAAAAAADVYVCPALLSDRHQLVLPLMCASSWRAGACRRWGRRADPLRTRTQQPAARRGAGGFFLSFWPTALDFESTMWDELLYHLTVCSLSASASASACEPGCCAVNDCYVQVVWGKRNEGYTGFDFPRTFDEEADLYLALKLFYVPKSVSQTAPSSASAAFSLQVHRSPLFSPWLPTPLSHSSTLSIPCPQPTHPTWLCCPV